MGLLALLLYPCSTSSTFVGVVRSAFSLCAIVGTVTASAEGVDPKIWKDNPSMRNAPERWEARSESSEPSESRPFHMHALQRYGRTGRTSAALKRESLSSALEPGWVSLIARSDATRSSPAVAVLDDRQSLSASAALGHAQFHHELGWLEYYPIFGICRIQYRIFEILKLVSRMRLTMSCTDVFFGAFLVVL